MTYKWKQRTWSAKQRQVDSPRFDPVYEESNGTEFFFLWIHFQFGRQPPEAFVSSASH